MSVLSLFSLTDTPTPQIYTLSLHDALPISRLIRAGHKVAVCDQVETVPVRGRKLIRREVVRLVTPGTVRSEEHTSELQSLRHLVCRLLLEKKKIIIEPDEIMYKDIVYTHLI